MINTTLNGIWTHISEVNSTFLDNLETAKIWNVFLWTGEWETDHTITYWENDATLTATINAIHNRNVNFKVYPFLYWGESAVDISTSGNRNLMYTAITACVNKGFDGFQDDLETYTGTTQNYIDYLTGVASTVHGLGKTASAALGCGYAYPVETVYPTLTLDYVCPMVYNGGPFNQSEMEDVIPRVLENSAVPVMLGLRIDRPEEKPYTLESQLGWVETILATGYPEFVGFSLWIYDDMVSGDWTAWDNYVNPALPVPVAMSVLNMMRNR